MNCPNCGAPTRSGMSFCENCGVDLSVPAAKAAQPVSQIPKEYKPIGPWGYIGWSLLYAIPVLGVILLIVFSFNKSNINRRNYARSYWCGLLLVVVLLVTGVAVAAATGTADELVDFFQDYMSSLS